MANSKLSNNGGYSWWTRPLAIQWSQLYVTAVANNGWWRVFLNSAFDTVAGLAQSPEADDHIAPAILVQPNKPRLVFVARHNGSNIVNYFRADSGVDFHDAGNLIHPSLVTYTQALESGDHVIVLSRTVSDGWRFFRSINWGSSWSTSREFLNTGGRIGALYMYATPTATPGVYNFAAYGHPVTAQFRGMYFGIIDMNTGHVRRADGTPIAHLGGPGLPLSLDDFENIEPSTGTERARLLDVGEMHGKPVIAYAKWDDDNNVAASYWLAHRNDTGTWVHTPMGVSTGEPFYEPSRYYGGVALSRAGDGRVYVSREDAGTWYIESYDLASDMTLGAATVIESDTEYPLVRPYAIEGDNKLLWQRILHYPKFNDYSMEYWTNG